MGTPWPVLSVAHCVLTWAVTLGLASLDSHAEVAGNVRFGQNCQQFPANLGGAFRGTTKGTSPLCEAAGEFVFSAQTSLHFKESKKKPTTL